MITAAHSTRILEIDTPHGPARAYLGDEVLLPSAMLVLGHGAGGGVGAADLVAAGEAANSVGMSVALVEQPYRVAGRRAPAPQRQLDAAWLAVIERLRVTELHGRPLVVGGRSAGARVACRTAAQAGAAAVLALAFPLHPPGRREDPSKSRLPELAAVSLPTLIVQGERDPFGMPPEGPNRTVVPVPGDHSLRHTGPLKAAVADWLPSIVGANVRA